MSRLRLNLAEATDVLRQAQTSTSIGRLESIKGPILRAHLPSVSISDHVNVFRKDGTFLKAKVIGIERGEVLLSPFATTNGLSAGARIESDSSRNQTRGGSHLLGSVIDAYGNRLFDSLSTQREEAEKLPLREINSDTVAPKCCELRKIDTIFETGIKAIDGPLTIGCGQRIAVFAEPGVGKTTLLGALASNSSSDVNVISLVGERAREVREFIEDSIDPKTRAKTVVIVSTSSDPSATRVHAALLATGIAEYFRDCGKHVFLAMDSLTRLFRAYRELGLAAGESPVRGGYPPSVFDAIPKLIERAGNHANGSITAVYSVLLSSSFDEDPMAEEIKGLTDGHIYLRKRLAEKGHFPAISLLESLSRLQNKLVSKEHLQASNSIRSFASYYEENKDVLMFAEGREEELLSLKNGINLIEQFLKQDMKKASTKEKCVEQLCTLANSLSTLTQ